MKITNSYNSFFRGGLILALLLGEMLASTTVTTAQNDPQVNPPTTPVEVQQPPGSEPTEPEETDEVLFSTGGGGSKILSAVVTNTGTLVRGVRAKSSANLGQGLYEVVFGRNVTQCTYVGTVGLSEPNSPPAGEISVAPRSGNSRGVFIRTSNSAGIPFNSGFHLTVVCP